MAYQGLVGAWKANLGIHTVQKFIRSDPINSLPGENDAHLIRMCQCEY